MTKFVFWNVLGVALLSGRAAWAVTTVTVCEEADVSIPHPAEYRQEKVRRSGLSCLAQPHCCTSAWVACPDCYSWVWTKEKNAWSETKRSFACKDVEMSADEALQKWMTNLSDPVPGFAVSAHDVASVLGDHVAEAYRAGQPIPDGIKAQAKALIAAGPYDFTYVDLSKARVLKASDPLAKPLWPGPQAGKAADGSVIPRHAITYYNLIIVADDFSVGDTCEIVERWAHELTHVHHHFAAGWSRFLERYLTQGQNGYQRISFEAGAVEAEQRAFKECAAPRDSPEHMVAVGVLHDAEEAWHRVPAPTRDRITAGDSLDKLTEARLRATLPKATPATELRHASMEVHK